MTDQPKYQNRRDVLKFGVTAAAGLALGTTLSVPARAQSFDWKRFAGTRLYTIFWKNPYTDELSKYFPEFTELTGIELDAEVLPELQARQKLTLEMTGGGGGLDAFLSSVHVEKLRYYTAGYYEPLNKYLEDPTLTAPDYEWTDFVQAARDYVTQADGAITTLPSLVNTFMAAYRKDLLEAAGLTPPTTLEEFEAVAKALHQPPGQFGFTTRGLKNANAMSFAPILFAHGGEYLKADGTSNLDTPPWTEALAWYARMLGDYGPPGAVNFNWYESSSVFKQGQAAMIIDGNDIMTQLEDPAESTVVGKVGYLPPPAGPDGSHGNLAVSGMAVSAQSRNKEAAYLFAQWATNKQNGARQLIVGNNPGRVSVRELPEVIANQRMPADFYTAMGTALDSAKMALPQIVGVTEYRDIIGVAIQKAIEGGDPAALMAEAHQEFQNLLNQPV